jgi:purine-cytosine permease-like protein
LPPHDDRVRRQADDPAPLPTKKEFTEEELLEGALDDYATQVVPMDKRRPLSHLTALMITLYLAFGYVFMGFEIHDSGYGLLATIGITALGTGIYVAYAVPAGFLGAKAGQTHAVLSRSIFGTVGSALISFLLFFIFLGWVGFQANLTAQMLSGLTGWGGVMAIGIGLAVLMIVNNVIGFTGIAAWARYVVAPLMILWILYLVIKGFAEIDGGVLSGTPENVASLGGLGAAVTLVIGFATWGQEPDFFRFAKPRLSWTIACYIGVFVVFLLCSMGGWMMASIAESSEFGPALKTITEFSFFGLTALAFILVVIGQVAVNDGNYYVIINGGQNVLSAIKGWNRLYTCALAAIGGGLAAWLVPYVLEEGFYKVAAISAIAIPTATVIMALDHFVVPRLFGIDRSLEQVPQWHETARVNWPALIALVVAMGFGGWASGVLPGQSTSDVLGIPAVEAWILAGVLYLAGVAVARGSVRGRADLYRVLGFSAPALAQAEARHAADENGDPSGAQTAAATADGPGAGS